MDFNKIIEDMKLLQEKVDLYEKKNKTIEDAIIQLDKEINKIEKKIEKETDLINKQVLQLKVLIMKDIAGRFKV